MDIVQAVCADLIGKRVWLQDDGGCINVDNEIRFFTCDEDALVINISESVNDNHYITPGTHTLLRTAIDTYQNRDGITLKMKLYGTSRSYLVSAYLDMWLTPYGTYRPSFPGDTMKSN